MKYLILIIAALAAASILLSAAGCGNTDGPGTGSTTPEAGTTAGPGTKEPTSPETEPDGTTEESVTAEDTSAAGTSEATAEITTAAATEEAVTSEATTLPETAADTTGAQDPEPEKELKILFLGNSLIYYNDMPDIFARIATAQGKKVDVRSVTKGSATMSDFADGSTEVGGKALPLLKNEKWDIVVIEPSRRISPYEQTVKDAEFASAEKLQKLAADAGAEIILYSVWGNNDGTVIEYTAASPTDMKTGASHPMGRKEHTKFMSEINEELSSKLGGVKIARAGYAFENCIAANPDLNLYHTDLRHPSPEGSLLAAMVFYETIFGETPDKTAQIAGFSGQAKLLAAADATVLGGVVPDLTPDPQAEGFRLLIVGSNLMDNYSMGKVFDDILKAEGKDSLSSYVRSSTFVINNLVTESNDLGLRAALAGEKWDAIIVQISRRCTRSSPDVAASEFAALEKIMPLLKAETDKIFLFTLNSKSKPSIFTTASGDPGYTDTGNKETYSAADGTAYFRELAADWSGKLGIGYINYGGAYLDYANPTETGIGYLQAAMVYRAVFGTPLPAENSATNGLSAEAAATLRTIAEKHAAD